MHSFVRCSSLSSLVLTNTNNLVPSALSSLFLFSLLDRYFNKQIKQHRAAAQKAGPKLTTVGVNLLHKTVYESQGEAGDRWAGTRWIVYMQNIMIKGSSMLLKGQENELSDSGNGKRRFMVGNIEISFN